jgi:hypothetical protein
MGLFQKNLQVLVMDDNWIRNHVAFCCAKHIKSERFMQGIFAIIDRLGAQSPLEPTSFIENVADFILESNDADLSLARRCVQEAIVYTIVDRNGPEPRIPGLYEGLAASAMAKHLWGIVKNL